jgi:hypothetical protein
MNNLNLPTEEKQESSRPYTPPAIVLELELETHAGSPLGLPDNLLDLGE